MLEFFKRLLSKPHKYRLMRDYGMGGGWELQDVFDTYAEACKERDKLKLLNEYSKFKIVSV